MNDKEQVIKNSIFNLLDRVEDKTGKMAHEIEEIKYDLEKWQNGEIRSIYFKEVLNKFFDGLNE